MAKFDFNSLKDSIAKHNPFVKKEEDFSDEEEFIEEEEEQYDDEYLAEDEYEEEDAEYEEDGEETGYEDEEAYDDAEEAYDGEVEYEDEDAEYEDDAEYDEEGEDSDGYDEYDEEEDAYGDEDDETEYEEYDEEEDEDELGYNPAIFENLDGEYEEEPAEAEEYDEYDEEYEDEDYEDENTSPAWLETVKGWMENKYILIGVCVLLPIVALLWLWLGKKYDKETRIKWSIVAVICLILWAIILLPGKKSDPDPLDPYTPFNPVPTAQNATPEPADTTEPDEGVTPTPTAHVGDGTTTPGTVHSNSFVYVTNSGVYYHTVSDCGGMQNASKVTLDTAVSRNLTACPDCAGGVNNYVDGESVIATTFYATAKGTWYHTNPTCQSMSNASTVTEANAIAAGKTACPVCIGYYGTAGGKYYHSISNCTGMQNAVTKTKAEWEKSGKNPCPTCIGGNATNITGKIPTETQVYYTTNGTYYHVKSTCSGMKNATQGSISSAIKLGKKLCKSCVTKSNTYVFATTDGKYYHTKQNCSGMKGASYITAKKAISAGKAACPTCAKMFASGTADNGSGTTATDKYTYVYYTDNGKYYHAKANCSGMANAKHTTYAQAVAAGKSPCTTCMQAGSVTVFATTSGKYFHTDSTCSKMSGAQAVTAATALKYGKTACPSCAYSLNKGFKATGTDKVTTTNGAGTTNTTNNASASAESVVYIKLGNGGGSYYHTAAKCSGQSFSGGTTVTLEYALSHGYKACPSCKPAGKIKT